MSIYERRVLTTTDRTHWTDPSGATVLPSTSITFNSDKKYYFTEPLALDIIDGNDYEVTWSGERYNAPAATMTAYGEECVYLGNKTGLNSSPDLDQGSFLLIVLPESMRDYGYIELIALDNYSSANVEIVCVSENVHFLDKKYLANANGDMTHKMLVTDGNEKAKWEDRTHYAYEEIVYLLPETTYTAADLAGEAADIRTPVTVESGKTYTVRYNGVDYQCSPLITQAKPILDQFGVTVDESVMGGILGNVGILDPSLATNEPFVLMVFQGTNILQSYGGNAPSYGLVMPLDGSTEITMSIQGVIKKYKTIPREYLPDAKEIVFTKGADGSYTCNISHDELWEMDADIIGRNARIIDGDEVYGVRGASKKTESLYGNVIQVYADLNVGKYDIPSTYHRTLIITYFIWDNVSVTHSEKVYSLSDTRNDNSKPDIPVLDGNGWLNRSIDFMEYDALHNVYTLKTMSETTKGGAMVGTGLEVVDGYLNVKPISSDRINEICGSTLSTLTNEVTF